MILGDEFSTVHIDWARFTAGTVEFHVDVLLEILDERETSAGTAQFDIKAATVASFF